MNWMMMLFQVKQVKFKNILISKFICEIWPWKLAKAKKQTKYLFIKLLKNNWPDLRLCQRVVGRWGVEQTNKDQRPASRSKAIGDTWYLIWRAFIVSAGCCLRPFSRQERMLLKYNGYLWTKICVIDQFSVSCFYLNFKVKRLDFEKL